MNSDLIYNEDNKNILFLDFIDLVNNSINKNTTNTYDYILKKEGHMSCRSLYKDFEGFTFDEDFFE